MAGALAEEPNAIDNDEKSHEGSGDVDAFRWILELQKTAGSAKYKASGCANCATARRAKSVDPADTSASHNSCAGESSSGHGREFSAPE